MAATPPLYICSDRTAHIVSCLFPDRRPALDILQVDGLKRLFGAMQQHSQVIAVNPEFPAYFILVQLFEENGAQDSPVALRHLIEDFANLLLHLTGSDGAQHVDHRIGEVGLRIIVNRGSERVCAIVLQQDVIADRVDEGSQTFRLAEAARRPKRSQDARESLLPDILDGLWRLQASAKFELNQFAEISDKMLLCPEIPGT